VIAIVQFKGSIVVDIIYLNVQIIHCYIRLYLLYICASSIFDQSYVFLRSQLHWHISNMAWITQLIRPGLYERNHTSLTWWRWILLLFQIIQKIVISQNNNLVCFYIACQEIHRLQKQVWLTGWSKYFSYIVAVSFIGRGNRNTQRKPQTCQKSLTNFIT
jgi:hypothetical protein